MERTVPSTASEEVDLYLRTYYSLLRTTAEIKIRTLEEVHIGMHSLLHPGGRFPKPDMPAFLYSLMRLPDCSDQVRLVVLGQSEEVFRRAGFGDVFEWQEVSARARRRRCFFDGEETLACFIASRSDIDDLIPVLTAFQIEWNKMHAVLQQVKNLDELTGAASNAGALAEILDVSEEDVERLLAVEEDYGGLLHEIARRPSDLRLRLLSGSLSEYRRATHEWWSHIERAAPGLETQPVYFVSSNVHSLLNVISGFPLRQEDRLVSYLEKPGNQGLLNEWRDIQAGESHSSRENFLYYVFRKFIQSRGGESLLTQQDAYELEHGIVRVPSKRYFDVEAQVIELARLESQDLDPRLHDDDLSYLRSSQALIFNVDYPLGMSAYNILSEVADHAGSVLGVYIMGKAATLNGVVGDVMIPNVVHDEQSQSTFLFPNCFSAADVEPYLVYGSVLDNQKAVTVQGTFLQTAGYMDVFYREGYTDIEMESGPYLSAVYEMHRPKRHPVNEIVNLYGIPFDLGMIHYASDTPLSKGRNLGAGSLSYYGLDATYAVTVAIMRRIFEMERQRLKGFKESGKVNKSIERQAR